jgi:hypothetical protein
MHCLFSDRASATTLQAAKRAIKVPPVPGSGAGRCTLLDMAPLALLPRKLGGWTPQNYSKDKKRRLKTNLTLSLILRFNLRLGGYSIWSAIIHRTPYKRKNSGHEHLIASMQSEEYSKRNFKMELRKKSRTASEVLDEPAALSYEELGSLSDSRSRGCVHQGVRIGLGDRTCPVPYLCCILPACGVELVDTEGNYSSCTSVRFLS